MTPDPATAPDYLTPLLAAVASTDADHLRGFKPPESGGRASAVLILFSETGGAPDVLLTERASTMRKHSGQVAFPGGARDPQDIDPVDTALREAREETGIDPCLVHVHATLPDLYIPVTGFAVTPVIASAPPSYEIGDLDPREVARAQRVRIPDLTDPQIRFTVKSPSGYHGPAFVVDDLFVWGFTALVLDDVLKLGGFWREWDPDRSMPLPERFMR